MENNKNPNKHENKHESKHENRHENKHATRNFTKKHILKILAVLMTVELVIILVLLLVYAGLKMQMDTLNNRISYLSDNTDVMINDIKGLKTDIEHTLEEESSLLESWSIKMEDLNFKSHTYTVSISLVPKEYSSETLTYIYFGVNEYQLELKGFKYVGQVDLPIDESYEGNVTVLFVNGKQRSTEVLANYDGIVNEFDSILSGTLATMPVYEDGKLNFDAECVYNLNGNDTFEFTSFDMIVFLNNRTTATYDLLHESDVNLFDDETDTDENGASNGDKASEDRTSDEDKTSDEDSDNPKEQGKKNDRETKSEDDLQIVNSGLNESMSRISGRYDNSESFDASYGETVRVCLRAVTKEGYIFTYDLFNGVIASEDTPEDERTQEGFVDSDEFFKVYSCVYDNKGGKYIIEE